MARESSRGVGIGGIIAAGVVAATALLLRLEIDYDVLPVLHLADLLGASQGLVRAGLTAVTVIAVVWILLRITGRVFERATVARIGSHAQARSIWKLIACVVWAVAPIILAIGFMRDVTLAALSLGLLGAAFALVLQKPLVNVVGWITITYHRIYRIGDRIAIGDVQAYVTNIKVMHTEL